MADRSSWSHYATVTTNTALISGTSTSVVGYLDLSNMDATFFSNAKADGSDIVIVPSGETTDVNKLPRELVGFSTATSVGELFFGPITVTSASSTSWDVWVGNASGAETNSTSVWSDCSRVYHMNQDPSGTAPQLYNSATGTYDGTSNGSMTSGDVVAAKIGDGINFDGSDDYFGPFSDASKSALTTMVWVKRNTIATWDGIYGHVGINANVVVQILPDGMVDGNTVSHYVYGPNSGFLSSTTITDTTKFYHIAGAYQSGSTHRLYIDGTLEVSRTASGNMTGSTNTRLGFSYIDRPMDGIIDEFRFYDVSLSGDQISTEYEQQNAPQTFWTYGSTTAVGGGGGGGTEDEVDSFEDTNFTADPAWTNASTGLNGWSVSAIGGAYDGTYVLRRTGTASGDESILTHTRPTADPVPASGDQWYAWFTTNSYVIAEQTLKYRLSDGTDYVEVQLNPARTVLTITDGTNSDTITFSAGALSPTSWHKLAINFNASGNVTAAAYSTANTLHGETATGITHSLTNVSSVQVRVLNGAYASNTSTYVDSVKYGQQGVAPTPSDDNALFFGAGA